MIYLYTGLAAAAFAYGVIQMFFLTRYADYQERMLRSFGERGGGLALVIDPQKLQHLSDSAVQRAVSVRSPSRGGKSFRRHVSRRSPDHSRTF